MSRNIRYNDLGANDEVIEVVVTEEEALARGRRYYNSVIELNPDHPNIEHLRNLTDKEIIEDFMIVHWAWYEDNTPNQP